MDQIPLNLGVNLAPQRKVFTVSELTGRIRDLLQGAFRDIFIEGEISNFKLAPSRHLYFTLKDARAQIRCVCFSSQARLLKFRPADGQQVIVRGMLGVYDARGEYQVQVETIEPVGAGALQVAFEQLKKKLAAEGLFDAARKKPLPLLPRRIGLITSPTGAVLRDMLRILRRRFPNLHIRLFPVQVQGDGAAEQIARAIALFNEKNLADVLIVGRGGGSLEDLWAFNEEVVARAIAESRIPVISAVGHETDFTIADFVADVRASTPSNAADIVVKPRAEFERQIATLARHLVQRTRYRLSEWRHNVRDLAEHAGFRAVEDFLHQQQLHADDLQARLADSTTLRLNGARQRLTVAETRLRAFDFRVRIAALRARLEQRSADLRAKMEKLLTARREAIERLMVQLDERSPLRVLERGYAIARTASGELLRDAAQVNVGDEIGLQLRRGKLSAAVTKTEDSL